MTPLDGLAFLISAISLIGPPAANACSKGRTGGASASAACNSASGPLLLGRVDLLPLGRHDLVENRSHRVTRGHACESFHPRSGPRVTGRHCRWHVSA